MQPLPMGTITVTAPAKVNLHLEVLGLRDDGFHELAMVMQSIDLADRLTFTASSDARLTLSCDDPSLSVGEDNLVLRAAQLLRSRSVSPSLEQPFTLRSRFPSVLGWRVDPVTVQRHCWGLMRSGAWGTAGPISSGWRLNSDPTCRSVWPAGASFVSVVVKCWSRCRQQDQLWRCCW